MKVNLTSYEERMLNGLEGRLKQVAIENIIKYAQVLGAEELCEVTKATVFTGSHLYLDILDSKDIDEVFSVMSMCSEEKLKLDKIAHGCYCQSCVAPLDREKWQKLNISKERFSSNEENLEYYRSAGVALAGSCIPYQTGWIPLMGEHFVTSESHVILMCNSIWGACGNSDGIEAGFWSIVCGRTPKWGNHIKENRLGTHIFNIECKADTETDWDLIGYTVGKKLPNHAIPVLKGSFKGVNIDKLKLCFASMATTSGAEMCHIVGVTPEAQTLEQAIGQNKIEKVISIRDEDLYESMKDLCYHEAGDVDYISLGCPHYSVEQLKQVSDFLEGKKINPNVNLQIWTSECLKTIADQSGYTAIIQESGGDIYTSSCPLVAGKETFVNSRGMAFDGGKQAHYIRSETDARVYYGSKMDCLRSAISGKWEGFHE